MRVHCENCPIAWQCEVYRKFDDNVKKSGGLPHNQIRVLECDCPLVKLIHSQTTIENKGEHEAILF